MDLFLKGTFTAVLLAECLVGIQINTFIVAVYLRQWKALKSLGACDKILICLGIFRSFRILYSLTYYLLAYVPHMTEFRVFLSATLVINMFLNLGNIWVTTVLCVFYCVKITNFSHKLFIFLKTRISRLVPLFLMASLLMSLLFSFPAVFCLVHVQQQNGTSTGMNNMTINIFFKVNGHNRLALYLGTSSFPFVIFCAAVGLLIQSLWMHSKQMKISVTSSGNSHLEVHFNVVKSMVLFLFCQVMYFITSCLNMSEFWPRNSPWEVLSSLVMHSTPIFHSAFIVASNSKLKEAFLEMWHGLTKCAKTSDF